MIPIRRRSRAFSLIEVSVALAIFTFATVGIVGLIPTALNAARQSLDLATVTQLANRLADEMTGAGWDHLPSSEQTFYFDDTGRREIAPALASYRASVQIDPADSPSLQRVQIGISRYPGDRKPWFFSFYVLNQGS